MKKKTLHIIAIAAIAVGLFFLIKTLAKPKVDYTEYFCGYDDRISFIVEGYQMHWDGFSPEDLELSYIYKYESPYGGFVKYDLDGDGTEELLLGDQYENGDYQIYDIFTFDKTTGNIIHLFCGGERHWCTFSGNGVIIETGSNSADDSFTNCYALKKLRLKKLGRNQPVTQDLLILNMDKFINSSIRDENGGPEMKVIIDSKGHVGRYVGENETSYQGDIQDYYCVEKDKAHIEIMKACDGQGILFLKEPGTKPVFSHPDTKSDVIGTMIHVRGDCPEAYRCLGYIKGWFLADIDGKSGYIQESLVYWDAINSF